MHVYSCSPLKYRTVQRLRGLGELGRHPVVLKQLPLAEQSGAGVAQQRGGGPPPLLAPLLLALPLRRWRKQRRRRRRREAWLQLERGADLEGRGAADGGGADSLDRQADRQVIRSGALRRDGTGA